MTPEIVLKASGHVERFTDFMVGWMGERVDRLGQWAGLACQGSGLLVEV